MHRSSETIGAIAAALAKAQAELTNPEKSLTATISIPGTRGGDRTFRYAPLSSGLDIVRKGLGRHEIAAMQTTAIDNEAGHIRLTTVLAHSSGEWISSDWPVCPVSETATPHRMGAALTYARRYSLFTLVGIAGEDDIDAPAAGPAPEVRDPAPERPIDPMGRRPVAGNGSWRKPTSRRPQPLVSSESAKARAGLIVEVGQLSSAEHLTDWAFQRMAIKNSLTSSDAHAVEEAFRARLGAMTDPEPPAAAPSDGTAINSSPDFCSHRPPGATIESPDHNAGSPDKTQLGQAYGGAGIDKSMLTIAELRRHRDKVHLKFVSSQACLVCGRQPSDPHHVRFAQTTALSRKVSDEFAVPLCRVHHREVHRASNEADWWNGYAIDALAVASALWAQTRLVGRIAQPAPPVQAGESTMSKAKRNRKTNPIGVVTP
jgi:hypothetical protein